MKKYELILQGGKQIIVDKITAEKILESIKNNADLITVNEIKFKPSMFKGLFPVKEEISDNKEAWLASNREWHELCLKMGKRSPEDKTCVEIDNRILSGLKLEKVEIEEPQMSVMYSQILDFFQKNPIYPRCPMRIWWPFVIDKIKSKNLFVNKYWTYVARNDVAIEEWIKYQNC